MEIVTGEPAPSVERDEAVRLLHEMAAVVRTVFAVAVPVPATVAAPAPPPVPAATVTPAAPFAAPPLAAPPLAPLPVPSLALPVPPDPEERPSLALLQEIAFLDE